MAYIILKPVPSPQLLLGLLGPGEDGVHHLEAGPFTPTAAGALGPGEDGVHHLEAGPFTPTAAGAPGTWGGWRTSS